MIKELIEADFNNVSPPSSSLLSLDLLIHEIEVYNLKGPVAIHTTYVNDDNQLFNFKLDELITNKIKFVENELNRAEIINKAIIITNLEQEIIKEYSFSNQIPAGIFLWGSEDVKKLLNRHKDILSKYNMNFFIRRIAEEIKYLSKDFNKRNEQISYNNVKFQQNIQGSLKNNQLALVLGAGVSLSANIPNWQDLVSKIYFQALEDKGIPVKDIATEPFAYWQLTEELGNTNLLIRTRYAKQLLGPKFLNVVHKWLYSQSATSSSLLQSIAELCSDNNSKSVNTIITYNFDNLVEEHLKNFGIDYTSIWRGDQNTKPNSLPIYHVHGFVPKEFALLDDIVFSEDDYHNQYTNVYSWSNIIQLNNFREKTCLFIGLSLLDPNIRRLLDVAKQSSKVNQHYVITKRIYSEQNIHETIENSKQLKELTDDLPDNHLLKEKYKYLNIDEEAIKSIMLTEELLIEKDFNSLGLNVIWINEYDELPKLLNKLKQL